METFSIEELRAIAKTLFTKAVSAVDPYRRLKEVLEIEKSRLRIVRPEGLPIEFDLNDFSNIYLIGAGKASAPMAQAIEEVFGDRITKGVITTKTGHALPLKRTEIIEAGHPIPDQKGLAATEKMVSSSKTRVPGISSFFFFPEEPPLSCPCLPTPFCFEEKQEVTQLLLDCGADIKEINTIRKHISQIKGGRLAQLAYPSTVLGFILSDVVGDPLDAIGSGPTVPDTSTFEEAWEILKKYDLLNEVAPSVHRHLLSGKEGKIEETPKPGIHPLRRSITS